MFSFNTILLVLFVSSTSLFLLQCVNGHGYSTYPLARQVVCSSNPNNNFNYPVNGSGISDPACRLAYTTIYNKYNHSQTKAAYPFVQIAEFAILIPNYNNNYTALKAAVPSDICSAYAIGNTTMGDKSGLSLAANWKATNIPVSSTSVQSTTIKYEFCATAPHSPSYWEFYVTKSGFDITKNKITWSNLDFLSRHQESPVVTVSNPVCSAAKGYKFDIVLPARYSNATLVVRWQRMDSAGESFIMCSDYKFVADPSEQNGSNSIKAGSFLLLTSLLIMLVL